MLVLSRRPEQRVLLGDDIVLTILSVEGDRVKLGIEAPRGIAVLREEVYQQVKQANAAATARRPDSGVIAAALKARRTPSHTSDTADNGRTEESA